MTVLLSITCWAVASGSCPPLVAPPLSFAVVTAVGHSPPATASVTDAKRWHWPPGSLTPFGAAATPAICRRRRKRIVIYCRFSTDQQNEQSLADQEAACLRVIRDLGFGDADVEVVSDAACSGEMSNRPGINRLWELVEAEACDIVVAEEVSRFFRHATLAMQFIECADDAGIRVITVNDPIDTVNDDWRLNGHFASLKAELDNRQTRQRIERARKSRWEKGYVVHHTIKAGYVRVSVAAPNNPARLRRPDYRRQPGYDGVRDNGPFVDQADRPCTPTIEEGFKMIANDEATWIVARYFVDRGLPRSSSAPDDEWTEMDVVKLIRDPIYRGEEEFRRVHIRKRHSKGDSIRVHSEPDQIWRRSLPHLRHVPDWLWYAANKSLDDRRSRSEYKRGPDHPLAGRTRDRRGALSTIFFCGVCGAPMYRDGRRYRCGNVKPRPTLVRKGVKRCWNRCMPSPEMVHANLGRGIVDAFLAQNGAFDALVADVCTILTDGSAETSREATRLERKLVELDRVCRRLAKALESDVDLEEAASLLRQREDERRQVRAELERIQAPRVATDDLPTEHDVRDVLKTVKDQLLDGAGHEANPLLRRLIGRIEAHPYQLFDTSELFLRANFEMNLLGFLPVDVQNQLNADGFADQFSVSKVPIVVNLFKVPSRIQLAGPMAELMDGGASVREAAERLGIPVWKARDAVKTGKAMAERGLDDAYIRMTSMPSRPPRWTPRSRPDVFDAD